MKKEEIKLQEAVDTYSEKVNKFKREVRVITNEFLEAESNLVEAKELLLKAQDELDMYRNTKVIEESLDVERNIDIDAFSKRLPDCMNKIKDEKLIPYKYILDLEDF